MPKLNRNGLFVELIQPGYHVKFSTPFGSAPLEQYMTDNGQRVSVISQPVGEGAQIVVNTSQDLTQGTGTGLNANPVDLLTTPYVPGSEYYAREEAFYVDRDSHEAVYQVSGKAPFFWLSVDHEDDCIPPDPRTPDKWTRWSTKYHDILGFGPLHYHQLGTPIYFAGSPQVSSGLLLLANDLHKIYQPGLPWYENACEVQRGNIASRMRISFKHSQGNSIAAIMFGINAQLGPNADINTIYNSPWSALMVNSSGGMAFHSNNPGVIYPIPGNYYPQVMTEHGVLVDVRTTPSTVQIFVEGALKGEFPRYAFGPYVGLLGSCTGGRIGFWHREMFDAGTEFIMQMRSTPRNTMLQNLSVYRVREPYSIPVYQTNLPVFWIDPGVRGGWWTPDPNHPDGGMWNGGVRAWKTGQAVTVPSSGILKMKDVDAIYSGREDGSAGMFVKIHAWTGSDEEAHVGIFPHALGLNNMPFSANYQPEPFSFHSIVSECAPKLRTDLL